MRFRAALMACLALGAAVSPALAQNEPPAAPSATVPAAQAAEPIAFLTVDQDRLFTESLWGKRAEADLEKASQDLQAENRKIEAALTAEEKSLTERRATMAAPDFRKLADEFDSRVTGIRQAQDTKARDLTRKRDEDRQAFFQAALPIMGKAMQERGALAILDSRAIFLSVRSIDATDEMIAAIDKALGDKPLP